MPALMNMRTGIVTFAFILCIFAAFVAGYASYPMLTASGTFSAFGSASSTETINLTILREAESILERDFFGNKPDIKARSYGATRGMVEAFGDPYTVFVEPQPQELQDDDLAGKFGGIGARIEQVEAGFALHPIADQPAAKAGVVDGDLLIQVDEVVITKTMTVEDVIAYVRGEIGTEVALMVNRIYTTTQRSEELTFRIIRQELLLPSIEWTLLKPGVEAKGDTPTIGYVRHTIFSERSASEMRTAIEQLRNAGADRLIWDLRGNPGGRVDAAVDLLDLFLNGGVVLEEQHADGSKQTFTAKAGGEAVELPLVLLVDGGSASASEIVAGALQDRGRAKLIGERTFGKGSVQLLYGLSDGSSLHVTNAQWFTPNGHQISGQGLTPDILVEREQDPLPLAVEELLKD